MRPGTMVSLKRMIGAGALAAVLASGAPPAAAQMSPPDIPFMAFYDQWAFTTPLPEGPLGDETEAYSDDLAPSAALRFRWSPEIGAEVRRELSMMYAKGNPSRAREIEISLGEAAIAAEFRRLIASYGYDPDNLAHVTAAFLILQWETFTGRTVTARQAAGVAAQLETNLRRAPGMADLGDTAKQRVADTLAHQAILGVANLRLLSDKGDRRGIDTLRAAILRDSREMGWDFSRLRLSSEGFVVP